MLKPLRCSIRDETCDHPAPEDEDLEQKDRLASFPDHTRGDVVDQDEAEEERQRLRDVSAERLDSTGIGDLRREGPEHDQEEWLVERRALETYSPVDQERRDPDEDDQRHHESVELDLKREICGQPVLR